MKYSIIVAKSLNNVIGVNNELPWKLSGDLKVFKKTTMGHSIIMGRKTFESIGKALPGRKNFVLTSNTELEDSENLYFCRSFEEVESKLKEFSQKNAFIIGGAQIYKDFFDKADCLYITDVHVELEGDAYFPEFNIKEWKCVEFFDAPKDAENDYPWTRKVFIKKESS